MALTLAEQETHLNQTAEDRSVWEVYTDDPTMIRKMERIGATSVREGANGVGKFYRLRGDQVVLRTGKRKVSEAQKAELSERMRAMRAKQDAARVTKANEGTLDGEED